MVVEVLQTNLAATICEGETFTVGNTTYSITGIYQQTLTSAGGCDSVVTLDLTVAEVLQTNLTATICEGETFTVGNTTYSITGIYQQTLTSAGGCDSVIQLDLVVTPCAFLATYSIAANRCLGDSSGVIRLWMEGGTPPYFCQWEETGSGLSGVLLLQQEGVLDSISGLPAGDYRLFLSDGNGLQDTLLMTLPAPQALTTFMEVSNFGGYQLPCSDKAEGIIRVEVQGGTLPYTITWNDGHLGFQRSQLAAGIYSVTIADKNGCSVTHEIELAAPPPIQVSYEAEPPGCAELSDGAIAILETNGGIPPFHFELRTPDGNLLPGWDHLKEGRYVLTAADTVGCAWQVEIVLTSPSAPFLYLGAGEYIDMGDSVLIEPQANFQPASFVWSPQEGLSCPACWATYANPYVTTNYQLTAYDSTGCEAEASLTIAVEDNRRFFVPNGFSPNGDGINDVLIPFGGRGVSIIKSFLVFNRWGESVWEYYQFPPNNAAFAWDGTFRGKLLDPAVFVWFAEVEFVDGRTRFFEGDVTLVR
jgi:gliding motility-associated-like protein